MSEATHEPRGRLTTLRHGSGGRSNAVGGTRLASHFLLVPLLFLAACRSSPPDPRVDGPIRVFGDVAAPTSWNHDEIEAEFADHVRLVEHVTKRLERHRLRAVPLVRLIEASRPVLDSSRKNPKLAVVVVLRARDGYAIAYTYDEIAPHAGEPTVFLAFADEEGPLPEEFAPARVVVVDGTNPSRALRGIIEIEVVDVAKKRTSPA